MKLLIIGATRGIGRHLTTQALEAGHAVTVLVRDPSRLGKLAKCEAARIGALRIVRGDVTSPVAVREAVAGQDAVCLTIGIPPTRKPVTVFSTGAACVADAMSRENVQRLVCVSGIGAGDSRGHGGFFYDRIVQPLFLKTNYEDKERMETIVRASDLAWTIVRPGFLNNGPKTGRYRILTDLDGITAGKISRADVAGYLLQIMATARDLRKTVLIDQPR